MHILIRFKCEIDDLLQLIKILRYDKNIQKNIDFWTILYRKITKLGAKSSQFNYLNFDFVINH